MLFGHVLAPVYLLAFFSEVYLFKNNSPWNFLPGTFYNVILTLLLTMALLNILVLFKRVSLWIIKLFKHNASATYVKTGAIVQPGKKHEKHAESEDSFDTIDALPDADDTTNVFWDDLYGDN
jgi:hypothetical protein